MAEVPRRGSCEWMYVLADERRQVDVHVFEYDAAGKNIYGVEYPLGSLTGHGVLGGTLVDCVAPEWMFRFKTAYEPAAKDLADIRELAKALGYRIPDSHVRQEAMVHISPTG